MYLWEYTLIYLYICICEYALIYLYAHTYLHLFIHVIGNKEVVRRAGKVCMSGSEDDIAAAVMLLDADLRGSELFQGINQASGGALFARKGANGQDIKTAPTNASCSHSIDYASTTRQFQTAARYTIPASTLPPNGTQIVSSS
jgi:hypothetical protein